MKVAIICEGITDFEVLVAVVSTTGTVERFTLLQPPSDKLTGPGPGWQGVRKFLQTEGAGLGIGVHDLVVVHVDAAVRSVVVPKPENEGGDADGVGEDGDEDVSLDPLCDHVKGWFQDGVPANAIIVLPREGTEAWLLAAHTNLTAPEEEEAPANELAERGLIEWKNGEPFKTRDKYKDLAGALVWIIKKNKTERLPELERFLGKVYAFRKARKK